MAKYEGRRQKAALSYDKTNGGWGYQDIPKSKFTRKELFRLSMLKHIS
jgi:hypothetical protein